MWLILVSSLCFSYCIFFVSGIDPCPNGYVPYKKEACFMFKHEQDVLISAEIAQRMCLETNGTLATIDNVEQDKWIQEIFMHDRKIQFTAWIGLVQDKKFADVWRWRDGSKSKYRNWNRGKPDHNSENEDCVHYDISYANESYPDIGWNDDVCTEESYRIQGYICRAPYMKLKGSLLCSNFGYATTDNNLLTVTGWAIGGSIGTLVVLILIAVIIISVLKKYGIFFQPSIPLTRFENE